ncbi:MAG TPA: TetR/AcrR family transcriptional regulator [Acidimicrobiia bacterium]|nr:TetR/AcrR family transcriptional regulator [Acidimicrobiia bacterium]
MRNVILDEALDTPERTVASRTLRDRADAYEAEVRRLVDAAYVVMRRTGDLDPRVGDIVAEASLSNQTFYRHFRSKDELLLTVLEDGQRRLLATLDTRMARVEPGTPRVRAWVEGVLEQARNAAAAANTRPFALTGLRLADRFPVEWARSRDVLLTPLRAAIADAGGDRTRDAPAVYHLAMGTMQESLARRERPSDADVEHIAEAAVAIVEAHRGA